MLLCFKKTWEMDDPLKLCVGSAKVSLLQESACYLDELGLQSFGLTSYSYQTTNEHQPPQQCHCPFLQFSGRLHATLDSNLIHYFTFLYQPEVLNTSIKVLANLFMTIHNCKTTSNLVQTLQLPLCQTCMKQLRINKQTKQVDQQKKINKK